MQYIQRDKLVHIEWSIFRGTSQVPEDFSRALVKMFLIGGNEKYLLTATAEGGKLLADLPGDLPEGAYSLEAIWVKNYGNLLPHRQPLTPGGEPVCPRRPGPHPNDPCFIHPHDHRFNDRCLMRSRKDYVFALTDYPGEETVTGESGEVTVRLASAVATYGYDGLSAYQIAVMRGDFSGTEGEFLAQSGFTKLKTINGESLIGEGDIEITGGGTLETATETKLGGIRAATKTQDETVEVKIDPETGKLYVPESEGEALEVATENKLGGIKASAKTDNETVEAKIGSDGKLYVPKGGEELKKATETTLGGIKAATKTNNETVEAKIGSDGKLYVPAAKSEELKTATETTLGGIRAATKTSLETQEVKIDPSTGKLYTQPGGEGGVEIVNNPDEEDLHSIEKSTDVHVLQFADKEYNASAFSGLGRVYLRKNISSNKNILTQAMMSKANTRYIIQYDYDLDGETITVPEGCTLDFQGGSISNGAIVGNKTKIIASLYKIFAEDLVLSGTWNVAGGYAEWFGNASNCIQKVIDIFNSCCLVSNVEISSNIVLDGDKILFGSFPNTQIKLSNNAGIVIRGANNQLYDLFLNAESDYSGSFITLETDSDFGWTEFNKLRNLKIHSILTDNYDKIGIYLHAKDGGINFNYFSNVFFDNIDIALKIETERETKNSWVNSNSANDCMAMTKTLVQILNAGNGEEVRANNFDIIYQGLSYPGNAHKVFDIYSATNNIIENIFNGVIWDLYSNLSGTTIGDIGGFNEAVSPNMSTRFWESTNPYIYLGTLEYSPENDWESPKFLLLRIVQQDYLDVVYRIKSQRGVITSSVYTVYFTPNYASPIANWGKFFYILKDNLYHLYYYNNLGMGLTKVIPVLNKGFALASYSLPIASLSQGAVELPLNNTKLHNLSCANLFIGDNDTMIVTDNFNQSTDWDTLLADTNSVGLYYRTGVLTIDGYDLFCLMKIFKTGPGLTSDNEGSFVIAYGNDNNIYKRTYLEGEWGKWMKFSGIEIN